MVSAYTIIFSMQEENKIVTATIVGSVTSDVLKRHQTIQLAKEAEMNEITKALFYLNAPSEILEHIDFLVSFFKDNYDEKSNDWSKDYLKQNDFLLNEVKLCIVKQYECFVEIDKQQAVIELLTTKTN